MLNLVFNVKNALYFRQSQISLDSDAYQLCNGSLTFSSGQDFIYKLVLIYHLLGLEFLTNRTSAEGQTPLLFSGSGFVSGHEHTHLLKF